MINTIVTNFYKEMLCIPKSIPNSAVHIKLVPTSTYDICIQESLNYYVRTQHSTKNLQRECVVIHCQDRFIELTTTFHQKDNCSQHTVKKDEIQNKESLSLFGRLNHFVDGAKYLSDCGNEERRVIASIRLFTFREFQSLQGASIFMQMT